MRHVAILVETSRAYGRGLLRGIARYNRERGRWHTYFEPHGLNDSPLIWLRNWSGDGAIARVNDRHMARTLLALNVPVVNLRGTVPGLPFPFIASDNEAVARIGASPSRRHLTPCMITRDPLLVERPNCGVDKHGREHVPRGGSYTLPACFAAPWRGHREA